MYGTCCMCATRRHTTHTRHKNRTCRYNSGIIPGRDFIAQLTYIINTALHSRYVYNTKTFNIQYNKIMTKSSKKRPVPLAPPPLKSRKKARKVTSLFHKLTQQMDRAKAKNDVEAIDRLEGEIDEMGGREEYQRASQLSTKFHSTSKWVLKVLGNKGWTNGIEIPIDIDQDDPNGNGNNDVEENAKETKKICRTVQILEVGAINTELVDAAKRTKRVRKKKEKTSSSTTSSTCTSIINSSSGSDEEDAMPSVLQQYQNVSLYNINIRAIDLRSTFADIEEKDFLQMPVENETHGSYDVIVCSMVLNCVTTPGDRGLMLSLVYKQLRPGGLCFFTIPRLCINQSKFIDRKLFEEILTDALGFVIDSQKETPKVAFWILKRPTKDEAKTMMKWNKKWEATPIIHRAQKFRNLFGVSLSKDHVYGR